MEMGVGRQRSWIYGRGWSAQVEDFEEVGLSGREENKIERRKNKREERGMEAGVSH